MAAVGHAREGGWLGVGRSWRSRMLGASLCLPAGNRLSGTPKAYRCPAGRWLRAGEQLGDTELRMGSVLCPAREGGRESAAAPAPKAAPSTFVRGKHRGSRRARPCPDPVRAQQDGDAAGSPQPEPWWPKKGPCLVPVSPCSTESTKHRDLHILLCLYSMYRIYSIGQLFPSRLEVSPKMTSFINKYIYIN